MDNELYNKYKNVVLSPELAEMFADLIMEDEVTLKVFKYIGIRIRQAKENDSISKIGATITDMTNDLLVNRPVKLKGKSKFKMTEAHIDRKRAERAVQSLFLTGLCYYEQVGKTKVIYSTRRGFQVLQIISAREKEEEKKTNSDYAMN